MKHAITSYFLGIVLVLVGCSSDDDVTTPTNQTGFFPKTITETTTNASSTITFRYDYDDNNRIISITNDSSTDVTLEYNDNGMIDKIIDNTSVETFEVNYDGNIITSFVETPSNTLINVDYNNGTYDSDAGTLTFDAQNQLIETGGILSIEYNTNPGPFAELDFQPVLFFLGGSSVTRACYFYAKNEVISFNVPLGGNLELTTVRNADGNISEVIAEDSTGQEIHRYEITYEERSIIQ